MFKRLINSAKKHIHLLLFLIGSGFLGYLLTPKFSTNADAFQQFQVDFLTQEQEGKEFISTVKSDWFSQRKFKFQREYSDKKNNFFIHVFKGDSLCFWNNNTLPFSSVNTFKKANQKVQFFKNGWYYSIIRFQADFTFVVSFGIQQVYPFENEFLQTHFFPPFQESGSSISNDFSSGKVVKNSNGKPVLTLRHSQQFTENANQVATVFGLILFLILVLWSWVIVRLKRNADFVYFAIFILMLRIIVYFLPFLTPSTESVLYDVRVFAVNEILPNFADFILWIFTIILVLLTLKNVQFKVKNKKTASVFSLLFLTTIILFSPIIGRELVENSSINLQLNELFQLDVMSVIMLSIIGIGGLIFVFITHKITLILRSNNTSFLRAFFIPISAVLIALLIGFYFQKDEVKSIAFSGIFSVLIFLISYFSKSKWSTTAVLFTLLFFAVITAYKLQFETDEKERASRKLFATELSDNRDVATEVSFLTVAPIIAQRTFAKGVHFSALKQQMEDSIFHGFWEKYDIDCFVFDKNSAETIHGFSQIDLEELIQLHGEKSEIAPNLYYINDYSYQLSYVFKLTLKATKDSVIFGTLKAKKLPEEIGYPRLLISDQTTTFRALANYSVAKYYRNQLTLHVGDFHYPVLSRQFGLQQYEREKWFNSAGFSHFVLQRTPDDLIILSLPNPKLINWITSVAFLMIGFGMLLVVIRLLLYKSIGFNQNNISLSTKIQLVMVGLVVLSLVGFSVSSSSFVTQQYKEYTTDLVLEKARSLSKQLAVNSTKKLFQFGNADDRSNQLRIWSDVYVTNLNYYAINGKLQGSSRPTIFSKGLLNERIHPSALFALKTAHSIAHIQTESIGNLEYLSAYVPLYDSKGHAFGFLNVQHFDQQSLFENQIQQFFIAIINVFMLLLVISIVGAIAVSSWLTSPLRIIQKHFNRVSFGKNNQPIVYDRVDEIGDLLAAYNRKLVDLEAAATLLAQSEREGAWREMAKQVAHEIKNPLTPMKLRIQQLERVFDPTDPEAKQKIQQVSRSIVEQIDALAAIANAFSNFAQFPSPQLTAVSFVDIIQHVAQVFESEHTVRFEIPQPVNPLMVMGDNTQLIRVFNNLFTNSIQAVEFGKEAVISIAFEERDGMIIIRIKDNGKGIPNEQIDTIFEPYFTTKSTGTGLGLALVKQIISGHQGTITIESTSEKGTTITLIFQAV